MNLELELDSTLEKKAIVFSFERSGTHFLMNTLEKNFGYSSYPWINLDYETGMNFYDIKALDHFFKQFDGIQVKNIFKSHHAFDFIEDLFPYLLQEFHVFYVYRNPLDALLSYWNYSKNVSWNEAPKANNILEFIKSAPEGAMLRYQVKQSSTLLERWENHVSNWLDAINKFGGIPILYDKLNTDFENSILDLSCKLNIKIKNPVRPKRDTSVVQPNTKNKIIDSNIKNESLAYINQNAGEALKKFNIKNGSNHINICQK